MGIITTIQRFSLNDGPGIRSSVFFKGCQLNCRWCHNPETIAREPQLHFYPQKCIHCGACVSACPQQAHQLADGRHTFDRSLCTNNGRCVEVCFSGALDMSGTQMSPEQVMEEIIQDQAYYRRSGGGVTLTGGEAMLQPDFARTILQACRENGIHTALETNLCYDFSLLERVLPWLDLVMADIKLADDQAHQEWTGASNQPVFDNIRQLEARAVPYIIRTPLIPDVTATKDNIRAIAEFLRPMRHLQYYELLNFNPLGHSKYDSLDLENIFSQTRPLPDQQVEALAGIARQHGLETRVN